MVLTSNAVIIQPICYNPFEIYLVKELLPLKFLKIAGKSQNCVIQNVIHLFSIAVLVGRLKQKNVRNVVPRPEGVGQLIRFEPSDF